MPGDPFLLGNPLPLTASDSATRLDSDGHGYSYDLQDMAAFLRDYDRLRRFWNACYPHHMHDFSYEALLGVVVGRRTVGADSDARSRAA